LDNREIKQPQIWVARWRAIQKEQIARSSGQQETITVRNNNLKGHSTRVGIASEDQMHLMATLKASTKHPK
jgi:hypothetical protein